METMETINKEKLIAHAISIKDAANAHFKSKRLVEAEKLYDEALKSLESHKGAELVALHHWIMHRSHTALHCILRKEFHVLFDQVSLY